MKQPTETGLSRDLSGKSLEKALPYYPKYKQIVN